MYLIVGLGNPGKEYENTRHNMGFKVLNKLSKKYNIPITKSKFNGKYGTGIIENEKVILLVPQTYMNLSGESNREVMDFYNLENKDIIITKFNSFQDEINELEGVMTIKFNDNREEMDPYYQKEGVKFYSITGAIVRQRDNMLNKGLGT